MEKLLDGPFALVNVARVASCRAAFRPGHRFGNRLLNGIVRAIFGLQTRDMLSGYKALTRRFAKSFPITSEGFEIETELAIHALELGLPVFEISAPYERPLAPRSKLSSVKDGLKILRLIVALVERERPFAFFTAVAVILGMGKIGGIAPRRTRGISPA